MKFFLYFAVFLITGCATSRKIDRPHTIEIHGHRGARGAMPENSLSAFMYAIEVAKVDVIELDLSVSKDDQLVVTHDPYIDPAICISGNKKRIKEKIPTRQLSLKQIKEFDCGSIRNNLFPKQKLIRGERIPTLDEVFVLVKSLDSDTARHVRFNIETKLVPAYEEFSAEPKKFAFLVNKIIVDHGMSKRVILQSFDHRTLVEIKKINKEIQTSALFHKNFFDFRLVAKSINADYISPRSQWINKNMVSKVHNIGVLVSSWDANDEKTWDYLIQSGVDAIITDYPLELSKYLKTKGLR